MPNKTRKALQTTSCPARSSSQPTIDDSKCLRDTLTNDLTWSKNVSVTAGKGNRVLGFLRRNLNDCSFRVANYATVVRPILQYAACVWDPYLQKDIQQLDQVQRRDARFTFTDYRDRTPGFVETTLQDLGWERLGERRKASSVSYDTKTTTGLYTGRFSEAGLLE